MNIPKTKSAISLITSISIALAPIISSPTFADSTKTINKNSVDKINSYSRVASTFDKRMKVIEESLLAQQKMMEVFSNSLKQSGQLKGYTNQQKDIIEKSVSKLIDNKTKEIMEKVSKNIQLGDWTKNLEDNEILGQIEKLKEHSKELKHHIEKQRDTINKSINAVCPDENPQNWQPLVNAGIAQIPNFWTSNLAAKTRSFGIKLPDCFNNQSPNSDSTVANEVDNFQQNLETGQELQSAISNMMMMAMSTGNPYIIAAAMVLMALMSIFSDGGGDGDGDGKNGQEGTTKTGDNDSDQKGDQNNQQDGNNKSNTQDGNSNNVGSEGVITSKIGSVKISVNRGENSITFFDTSKAGKPFILQWDRIVDANNKAFVPMPPKLHIDSASPLTRTVVIKNIELGGTPTTFTITPHNEKRNVFVATPTDL